MNYLHAVFESSPQHKILVSKMLKAIELIDNHHDFIKENPGVGYNYVSTNDNGDTRSFPQAGNKRLYTQAFHAVSNALWYGMNQLDPNEFRDDHTRYPELLNWVAVMLKGTTGNGGFLFPTTDDRKKYNERIFEIPPTMMPEILCIAFIRYVLQFKRFNLRPKDMVITVRGKKCDVWRKFYNTFGGVIQEAFKR